MGKIPFEKPPLNLEQQIQVLMDRGMKVVDAESAKRHLHYIGYYHLSGYYRYFLDPEDSENERFRPGVTFQDALDLYVFDRQMRNLLMDAFERIEIAIKSAMTVSISPNQGIFWLHEPQNFDYARHDMVKKEINDAIAVREGQKSQFVFIDHFYRKYSDPQPPCWMVFEAMSFGAASRVYKLTKGPVRREVAEHFDVQHDVLESWLHALVFGRNVCAHHSRLWNRRFTIKPKIPKKFRNTWPTEAQNRLYVLCCIIKYLMARISPESHWSHSLRNIVNNRPAVELLNMGFPDDWEQHSYWEFGS